MTTTLPALDTMVVLPLQAGEMALAGLIWCPLSTLQKSTAQIQQLMRQEDCHCFVMHSRNGKAQCGMVTKMPSQGRYYSTALLLIDQLGDHWVGLFELHDQHYLLIGVAEGQVVPGCDVVLNTAIEAQERLQSYQNLFNWQTRYLPADFGLDGEALNIYQLLKQSISKPEYRLRSTGYSSVFNLKWLGWVCCALFLLTAVTGVGRHYQVKQKAALELKRERMLRERKQCKARPQQAPWLQQPPAHALLHQCVQGILRYPVMVGGWRMLGASCTAHGINGIYQRTPSYSVKHFLAALPSAYAAHYQFKSSDQAQISQPLVISEQRHDTPLPPLIGVIHTLLHKKAIGALQGQLEEVVANGKKSAQFSFTSRISPLITLQGLEMNGWVIQSLQLNVAAAGELVWTWSGTIYGE